MLVALFALEQAVTATDTATFLPLFVKAYCGSKPLFLPFSTSLRYGSRTIQIDSAVQKSTINFGQFCQEQSYSKTHKTEHLFSILTAESLISCLKDRRLKQRLMRALEGTLKIYFMYSFPFTAKGYKIRTCSEFLIVKIDSFYTYFKFYSMLLTSRAVHCQEENNIITSPTMKLQQSVSFSAKQ